MIFLSYSKNDIDYRNKFQLEFKTLEMYSPENKKALWIDNQIEIGGNWSEEIKAAKDKATLAICLVSKAFLASEFIHKEELTYFIDNNIRIYWFYLEDCNYGATILNKIQAVTIDGGRLVSFKELIANGKEYLVDKLISEKSKEMFDLI